MLEDDPTRSHPVLHANVTVSDVRPIEMEAVPLPGTSKAAHTLATHVGGDDDHSPDGLHDSTELPDSVQPWLQVNDTDSSVVNRLPDMDPLPGATRAGQEFASQNGEEEKVHKPDGRHVVLLKPRMAQP